jgi:hypothetical protein
MRSYRDRFSAICFATATFATSQRPARQKGAQHADEGVSVLVADFVVLVAVAIVETGLAHAALHGAQGAASSRSGEVATKAQRTGV